MDERMVDPQLHRELIGAWIRDRVADAESAALVAEIREAEASGEGGGPGSSGRESPFRAMARAWRRLRARSAQGTGSALRTGSAQRAGSVQLTGSSQRAGQRPARVTG